MKRIKYITNLHLKQCSGGWSGINLNIFKQLERYFRVESLGPIDPPFIIYEKGLSKLIRKLGLKGGFSFFSEKRLDEINKLFEQKDHGDADAYFFFGNTPWIKIKPQKPYYVYMDADFITYLKVFSEYSQFSKQSIERIASREKVWLENAQAIFFGSHWIMNETISNLNLPQSANKYLVVNTGGHMPIPEKDNYVYDTNKMHLLFIALNFEKKGGHDVVKIFLEIKKYLPETVLTLIGDRPPDSVLSLVGVSYLGRLDKNKPDELNTMVHAFQSASFLVHPTKMDTMGAIIPEANYYGTPAVASNRFGIPDLIQDEITGILINDNDGYKSIASKMIPLFKDKIKYLDTRNEARNFAMQHYSWDAIGKKISHFILNKS